MSAPVDMTPDAGASLSGLELASGAWAEAGLATRALWNAGSEHDSLPPQARAAKS